MQKWMLITEKEIETGEAELFSRQNRYFIVISLMAGIANTLAYIFRCMKWL